MAKYPIPEKTPEIQKKKPLSKRFKWFWNEEGGREFALGTFYFILMTAPIFAPIIVYLFLRG